jgi:hypothetical protein
MGAIVIRTRYDEGTESAEFATVMQDVMEMNTLPPLFHSIYKTPL